MTLFTAKTLLVANFSKRPCRIYPVKRGWGEQDPPHPRYYKLPSKYLGHCCTGLFKIWIPAEGRDQIPVSCSPAR